MSYHFGGWSEFRCYSACPRIWGPQGNGIDAKWSVIEPYSDRLIEDGYGFSIVNIGLVSDYRRGDCFEMLMDGGWNDTAGSRPDWLVEAFDDQSIAEMA